MRKEKKVYKETPRTDCFTSLEQFGKVAP